MANQIATQFGYLPTDQAVTAVAEHIKRFWDPRMKRRLTALADSGGGELDPVAVSAAALLR